MGYVSLTFFLVRAILRSGVQLRKNSNIYHVLKLSRSFKHATVQERLAWIGKNELRFSMVASLARHILGIPATQIENERVFSLSGRIANPLRNRLKTTVIDQMVSIGRKNLNMDNIESRNVATVTSIEKISEFLKNAKDLEEKGDIQPSVFSCNLGVNNAVVQNERDTEEERIGFCVSSCRE